MTLYILVIGDEVRELHRHVFEALGQVLWGCNLSKIRNLCHTFASSQLKNEAQLIRVSTFLGRLGTSTTAKIYAHLDRSSK